MKVLNEYPGHHYWQEYLETNIYCPACGSNNVFTEKSEGDYYYGPNNICVSCERIFTIQGPNKIKSEREKRIIRQICGLEVAIPKTPLGN